MSVQSDLYDTMFDGFEYKEQVTTCDPYDCKIPLCLTEHGSLAIAHSPPDSFAALLVPRSTSAAGSWAEGRGKASCRISVTQLCCQTLSLSGQSPVPLNLGSRRGFPLSARTVTQEAFPALRQENRVPVAEILPAVCMALGKCITFYTQIRTVSSIDKVIA